MTTTLLILLFRRIFGKGSSLIKILTESFSVLLTLALIFYAGESFHFKVDPEISNNMSLFTFLLLGEVALVLPMSAAERFLGHFRELRNQQFYQTLLGLRISPFRFVFSQVLIDILFPMLRVVLILIGGALISSFQLSFLSVLYFCVLQIFSLMIFLLMALIASLVYLKFNRGFGFFYTFQTVSTVIGGAYFPVSIFPSALKNFSSYLPQTQILNASRFIFSDGFIASETWPILFIWFLSLGAITYLCDRIIVSNLKTNGRYI